MLNRDSKSIAAPPPPALRPATLRKGLVLAIIAALAVFAVRAEAQPPVSQLPIAQLPVAQLSVPQPSAARRPSPVAGSVPFAVGEELVFHATFGGLPAGTARMRVDGIDTVRGRLAYHVVFSVDGGLPFSRVHARYESWMDVATLSSLRHEQHIS